MENLSKGMSFLKAKVAAVGQKKDTESLIIDQKLILGRLKLGKKKET
jgi:hypothetical protein